jgi:hypothetical protein
MSDTSREISDIVKSIWGEGGRVMSFTHLVLHEMKQKCVFLSELDRITYI